MLMFPIYCSCLLVLLFFQNINTSFAPTTTNTRMNIQILKSKIHKAKVTQAELNYEGSITIDEDLMLAAQMLEWEKVLVVNNNNGERLETYIIKGEKGSGVICMNGAAARKVQVGDELIIMSFASTTPEVAANWTPIRVFVNDKNKQV